MTEHEDLPKALQWIGSGMLFGSKIMDGLCPPVPVRERVTAANDDEEDQRSI